MHIEATPEELQSLAGLIDAGLRATGLRAAKDAALWIDKIDAALSEPTPEEANDGPERDA